MSSTSASRAACALACHGAVDHAAAAISSCARAARSPAFLPLAACSPSRASAACCAREHACPADWCARAWPVARAYAASRAAAAAARFLRSAVSRSSSSRAAAAAAARERARASFSFFVGPMLLTAAVACRVAAALTCMALSLFFTLRTVARLVIVLAARSSGRRGVAGLLPRLPARSRITSYASVSGRSSSSATACSAASGTQSSSSLPSWRCATTITARSSSSGSISASWSARIASFETLSNAKGVAAAISESRCLTRGSRGPSRSSGDASGSGSWSCCARSAAAQERPRGSMETVWIFLELLQTTARACMPMQRGVLTT